MRPEGRPRTDCDANVRGGHGGREEQERFYGFVGGMM